MKNLLFFIVCLFWAALGLRCCVRACSSRRFIGSLLPWLLLLWSTGAVVGAHVLHCSAACEVFPDQALDRSPCFGRWILIHWTTREVPSTYSLLWLPSVLLFRYNMFNLSSVLLKQITPHWVNLCESHFSLNLVILLSRIIEWQFSSVQSLSRVWLLAIPLTAAHQASLSITNS